MHTRSKTIRLRCGRCGRDYPMQFRPRCEDCNGLLDPVYDLDTATIVPAERPAERYFDLLPFEHLDSAIDLGEGNTPCRQAHALGECVGLRRLYLKNETVNPTRTTKDRMASCVLSFFQELGVREFVATSTGNSSTALAYGVQQVPEMQSTCSAGTTLRHGMPIATTRESTCTWWMGISCRQRIPLGSSPGTRGCSSKAASSTRRGARA